MGKRQDILSATLDLIDEEGLQSVTFAKIFKKARVGSGTVFNYFKSKEELVNEVYREARIHMGQSTVEGYDPELSLYERFKQLQLNRLQFGMKYPKEFLFIDSYSYSPYISAELRNMEDPSKNVMQSVLIEGQKQGLIREIDPHICHQITHGIMISIVKGYLIGKYALDEREIQQTLEACWKAVKL